VNHAERWRQARDRLETIPALRKRSGGEILALVHLLVEAEIQLQTANNHYVMEQTRAEVKNIRAQIATEASFLAEWAVTGVRPKE